ncbi:MAG: DUF3644 domain-containing protein, partial [Methanosarcinaceae archaeon]|nr:DUF3644 domain-containing protein [Methanosarcinaceae archaeon]
FHSIFFRRKLKPYYRKSSGRYERVDSDYRHWELTECLRRYYGNDTGNPVRKNLEFFIPLRNKIEHRSLPELDPSIFGECQAMLLNFDDLLGKEFGEKYRIRQCLSFALQMYPSAENLAEAVKRNRRVRSAADFIEQYRSAISPETLQSGQYAFKAFLIQVANHPSKDALAIQFIDYGKLTPGQKEQIKPLAALVKHKHVPVFNEGMLNAGQVAKRVQKAMGDPKVIRGGKPRYKFNIAWHTKCWQHFEVRPPSRSPNPEQTNATYCIFDRRHNDYGYTEAWVSFLIEKFKDDQEAYDNLFARQDEPKA